MAKEDRSLGAIPVKPMHGLETRVAELGVCTKCHKKTLREKHADEWMRWSQCETCLTIYVLPLEAA